MSWRLLSAAKAEAASCPTCGAPMQAERRRPGRRALPPALERRDIAAAAGARGISLR